MAAIVELFPLPVTPVTRINPRSVLDISSRTGGSLRSANVGI